MSEPYVLLDARGLALHCYYSGDDKHGGKASDGSKLATPGHTIANFIDRYLVPITNYSRLNRIIAVWDGGNEFRKRISQGTYKANREEPLPEIKEAQNQSQKAIKSLLSAFGIVQCSVDGVEADDVIAWFVRQLSSDIAIYTRDGDLIQLAQEHPKQVIVFQNEQPKDVGTFKGIDVHASLVCLFKSLCGDDSDGYGGVRGFGPKAWEKLLAEADQGLTLPALIAAFEQGDTGTAKEIASQIPTLAKAVEQFPEWVLGWRMAQLHPELVNERKTDRFNVVRWHKRLPTAEKIEGLLRSTGNEYLIERVAHLIPRRWIYDANSYSSADVEEARALFAASPAVAIDWETKDILKHEPFKVAAKRKDYVDARSHRLCGAGFTCGRNYEHTWYMPFDHQDSANLPKEVLLDLLDAIPEDVPTVAYNSGFEQTILRQEFGVQIPNIMDVIPLGVHVDEQVEQGLKDQSLRWLGHNQAHYEDVVPEGKDMGDLSVEEVFSYGADDPFCTAHLWDLFQLLLELEGTLDFALHYETRAQDIALEGNLAGITVDEDELYRQGEEDAETVRVNMERLRALLAEHTDANTARAGGELLYNEELDVICKRWEDGDTRGLIPEGADRDNFELEDALKVYRDRCIEAATYAPLEIIRNEPKQFSCTFNALSKIAGYLGLPAMEVPEVTEGKKPPTAPSNVDIGNYLRRCGRADPSPVAEAAQFLALLGEFSDLSVEMMAAQRAAGKKSAPKKRDYEADPRYIALRDFCLGVTWNQKSEKDKWTKLGSELNLNSPPQMHALLYGILALPIRIRQPLNKRTGYRERYQLDPSAQTNEDAIKAALLLDADEPWKKEALECLQEAKKAHTRIQNFYASYPLWIHPETGNIHPKLMTAGTKTRRPTSGNPNMLNWPKKGEGVKFRRCILPNKNLGHDIIVSSDWEQLELRLAAGLSGDKAMLACYTGDENEKDIHALTAHRVAGVTYEAFMAVLADEDHPLHKQYKDVRAKAKNTTFGSQYGIGPAKLARQIMQPEEVAREYLDQFADSYWRLVEWKQEQTDQLHRDGYLRTALGSYRHCFNDLFNPDKGLLGHIERSSVNAQIQGLAADYLKVVLVRLQERGFFERTGAVLICPLYDEIILSCHSSQAVTVVMELNEEMTRGIPGVPIALPAAPALGLNFGDQIEIGRDPTPARIQAALDKAFGITTKKAA